MATNKNSLTGGLSVNFLPDFYQTSANKKFLQATLDQLYQPGTVTKTSGFIGRQNAKASSGKDIYVTAVDQTRQNYQLEPSLVVQDDLGNVTYFKDYIDYINQISVFGGNTTNHSRLNKQEFYSWDPHIDWDKFVNFQNYYWLPYGPETITIYGQPQKSVSTYTVVLQSEGDTNQYLFTPNGLTLNPALKLYRGQTYIFEISSIGNPFSIKTNRSTGNSNRYVISGIDNYGVQQGTITFTVPVDAPNTLYYQSETDINLGGIIEVYDITSDTAIDVDLDIVGKKSYTLSNGTSLSNGMKVAFGGNVTPSNYATGNFYVEGVGVAIKLIPENILEIVSPYTTSESVEFDATPFDVEPFSDSTGFAGIQDYIVINRASRDKNPWSRYNRWFHIDVINASATYNGDIASLDQASRATRPIIEFEADLKLFNLGTTAIEDTDLIDTFTTDVFSTIEGATGYNIDGVSLANGQRIIFTADLDPLVTNNVYQVEFVNIAGTRQIHLTQVGTPSVKQSTIILQGIENQSQMYWFNGTTWVKGQQKTNTNQSPLFDLVDENEISFGDASVYNGTTFIGTPIFSYKAGSGTADPTLGFALSYLNVANIGDIVFNFNLATDSFQYKNNSVLVTQTINVGYLISHDFAGNTVYKNGWQTSAVTNTQAAVRVYRNSGRTNNFDIDIFDNIAELSDLVVRVYINGIFVSSSNWSLVKGISHYRVLLSSDIALTDVLTIKAFAAQSINSNGYYEIPMNLQNNPLNNLMGDFTLGEVTDHVTSIIENASGFSGTFPGASNLRDLGNITQYGTKFVQHSGPLSIGMYHITSEANNIIKAVETSQDDYNSFKRNFLLVASSLGVDTEPSTHVDLILQKINSNKPKTAPYYFSDMVPYGAAITSNITVVDYRIKIYPLTNVFSLDTLSNKAVCVYQTSNGVKTQLVYGRDYTFSNQASIVITDSVLLKNGDTITTVEYDNTDGSFVPSTPTKLGMWPAYIPQIFTDTTLVTPQTMIQGHDGSVILAYGDYRDALILELETRIFNNIKVKYDPTIFDISDVIPGYSRSNDYSLSEFNQVLAPNFYKWTSFVGVDFSQPLTYDRSNSFTFNYSNSVDPSGEPTPGYWRGVYRWLLDTDRPHTCPWEMLGFSIMPTWWTSVYGPAPYTSDNLVLWKDLANGIVREPGTTPVTLTQYIRPFLLQYVPVDESGNLLSPYTSGLAQGSLNVSVDNNFVFGDVSPVEAAWRRSSYYPFSVIIASMLLTPAKTFGILSDRSRIIRNLADQLIYTDTGLHIAPSDIKIPSIYTSTTRVQTAGIVNWVVDLILNYIFSNNTASYDSYINDLQQLNPQLSYRVGAFTNKDQFNLLLESKTPLATGSVFIPQESYNIFLNTSSPVTKLTYSGVIITKLSEGYEIKGYSKTQPYFNYYSYNDLGTAINIGGISENFVTWTPSESYSIGTVVRYGNSYYRTTASVASGLTFNLNSFAPLSSLPIVGGVTAYFRNSWDTSTILTLPYGTLLPTIQSVVDFLTGYGAWLTAQGFQFDDFNGNLNSVANWDVSAKEFMFWTTQNWSAGEDKWSDWLPNNPYTYGTIVRYNGNYYSALYNIPSSSLFDIDQWSLLPGLSKIGASVISLSPAANGVSFTTNLTVVDNIANSFNDYEILKVDGTPLQPSQLDSYRIGNTVTYSPLTNDGIYCATFYLIQNEHVVIINNVDIFNDVIYNPPSGYRRDRIKLSGYVTTNWYGGLDIPGFIFDQAKVDQWQPWQDYNMGDVISFQGYYYSANAFTAGTSTFVSTNWTQLASKPTPKILPNWTNIATQFTDFYSLDVDSFDSAQQTMGQHLLGYQKRQYLDNIIQDSVSEFKFYQGMIRDKGTQNVLNHLFGVLTEDSLESLTFYEEWALRVGRYGASNAFEDVEFILDQNKFRNNPQGFLLTNRFDSTVSPFIIQQTPNDVYLKPLGYDSNPFPALTNYQPLLRSAGYVNPADVKFSLKSIEDITSQDITQLDNGDYVWCAFENATWNIYRFTDLFIRVTGVTYNSQTLTITTENIITLKAGQYIGLAQVSQLAGFYKIASVSLNTLTVSVTIKSFTALSNPGELIIYGLLQQKTSSIDTLDSISLTHIQPGEIVWTDDSGNGAWASWKYTPVYTQNIVKNQYPAVGLQFGSTVAMNSQSSILAISNSNGTVSIYDKVGVAVNWVFRTTIYEQFLSNDTPSATARNTVMALSTDGTWLATGSPAVGYVTTFLSSHNSGVYDATHQYSANDIVSYNGAFYQAIDTTIGNTPSSTSLYWELTTVIPVNPVGYNSTYSSQGVISIFKKDTNNNYSLVESIISPTPIANENFGASLVFGTDIETNNPVLYVGATGGASNGSATPNVGRVYTLTYGQTTITTAEYNPVGSVDSTLVVNSTAGIRTGMLVQGAGFTSGTQAVSFVLSKLVFSNNTNISKVTVGMTVSASNIVEGTEFSFEVYSIGVEVSPLGFTTNYVIVRGSQDLNTNITTATFNGSLSYTVESVINLHTILLTSPPDSTPSGRLNFVSNNWNYSNILYNSSVSLTEGANFGKNISISQDGSTLAISQTTGTTNGAVHIYKNSGTGFSEISSSPIVGTGINFGIGLSVSSTGSYIAISDDNASSGVVPNQGTVKIYSYGSSGYSLYQTLVNHKPETDGRFGNKIAFTNSDKTIVVYSEHGDTTNDTTFNNGTTTFDKSSTNFITVEVNSGRIDVYDNYNTVWVFSESLTTTNVESDGYGAGFAVGNNQIVVSAPLAQDQSLQSGLVYAYNKVPGTYTWAIDRTEISIPDVSKIKKAFLYNKSLGTLLTYIDVIDPLQGKIAGPAEEEIKYKTFYDPATYSQGTAVGSVVDISTFWADQQLGMLWWNLSTAKFYDTHFDDIVYATNTWNTLAPGASIDVYEWVSYNGLPSAWDTLADTPAGLTQGISGKSLYGNNAYSVTQQYDNISKKFTNTYYFWVKNKQIIPNVDGRNMSANDVASLIASPRAQGYTCLALTGTNSFSLINAAQYLKETDVVLAIEYWLIDKTDQNIHSQWKLISDDTIVNIPSTIEQKWFDSLCGVDANGRDVPDITVPVKLRYGVENRPRQSMFVNRIEALKEFIERVNIDLISYQISSSRDISALESFDPAPTLISGLYGVAVDTYADLAYVNPGEFTLPVLTPIITNGRITGINIVESGKGYLTQPYITVTGSGENAVLRATINALGQVTGATIINSGDGYDSNTQLSVRDYSVLVQSDETANGVWSIYAYNPSTKTWSRTLSQSYDVRNYWSYADWYATGFNQFTSADYLVATLAELNSITPVIGTIVKVTNATSNGWVLLECYSNTISVDWTQVYNTVGIQNGTIQFNTNLYDFEGTTVGYDSNIFDDSEFDVQARTELRIILNTIKNNILINDLKQNYLDLFFSSVRYAHTEQPYIDWIFKTSFVRATHNVGQLDQPINYPIDNLSNFQDYINEVKPYRTKIREYISQYTGLDTTSSAVTDFDLQPRYENGSITSINAIYENGSIQSLDNSLQSYPWKFWYDNAGFTVTDIKITNSGTGYITAPQVIFEGASGSGAVATAYITNGSVNRIILINGGSGFLGAPSIILNGGLTPGGTPATAVAIIGNPVVRSTLTELKFDRIDQTYVIANLEQVDTFTGTGSKLQFPLTWAPDVRIGQSSVTINGNPVLRELYTLKVVSSTSAGYTQYSGLITFNSSAIPVANSTIVVTYNKSPSVLNATDRIQYYYNPASGQLGKDLSQLLTGIDYGGVSVSGIGFNVSGGWGSTPFYTETWDNRDPTFNDYYVQANENTRVFILPYTPANGTSINIYYVEPYTNIQESDGVTLGYNFDINVVSPSVSVSSTINTLEVETTYTGSSTILPGYTLTVASTTGIVPGMVIYGNGFNSRQYVVRIINSTQLSLNAVPDSIPSGTLVFGNTAGGTILSLTSVEGISIGDVVSSSIEAFSFETTVIEIDSTSNIVTLSAILLLNVPANTGIIFTKTLVDPTDVIINANGTILLAQPYIAGTTITISGTYNPVRLDDPNFGTAEQTNNNAIMATPVVGSTVVTSAVDGGSAFVLSFATTDDGGSANSVPSATVDATTIDNDVSNVVELPATFVVASGAEFIIRESTSDGSIPTNDSDYDSNISGGDLAYSTATGLAADDIILDGDGLVTETSSPAPEEVVPGQVVDTLAIKIYDRAPSGAASIRVNSIDTDGITSAYAIGQTPNSNRAVIVKLGTAIKTYGTDYTVNYVEGLIEFTSVPSAGQVVSIFSIGFNGDNILDLDYFVGDGTTTEFVTRASWQDTVTALIYVNGVVASPQLFKTDSSYEFANAIGLRFATPPVADSIVNYIIVSGNQQTFAITKTETVPTNGATSYTLQYPIGKELPNESNMFVRVDQSILQAPNNSYFTIGSNRLNYSIDPTKAIPYSATVSTIIVYADGNILTQGSDYTVDPSGITIKISKAVYKAHLGQKLIVSLIANNGYSYNPVTGVITFAQAYDNTHVVEVISNYVQDILDIERTEIQYNSSYSVTPGTVEFYSYNSVGGGLISLDRPVIDNNYVWVTKNSTLLTPSIDYKLNDDLQSITLAHALSLDDTLTIITFGSNILPASGISYMQFKSMLNNVSYIRLNANKRTTLAQDLNWNDTSIVLTNAANLDAPSIENNKPGVIEIRGERIEYFQINYETNTLSQIRRGTLGTGVYNLNRAGSAVQGLSGEIIPYNDTTVTETVVAGTYPYTTEIDIGFVPLINSKYSTQHNYDSVTVFVGGYNSTIWAPKVAYSVGDIVTVGLYSYKCITANTSSSSFAADSANWEFFVSNIRLQKDAYKMFNINVAPYSPAGDVTFPADFTVDGITAKVTLTNPVAFGTQVTVVKQTGLAWDSTTNILVDNSQIANFIKAAPGVWYTDYKD
jgi:hypothetical protein